MFTEGLDKNALRWVREGTATKNGAGVPSSIYNQRVRIDPVHNMRSGGRGFGLPPSKFTGVHLQSGAIPVHRPTDADDSGFGSDMEEATDSEEEEVYGGRYSLDSSPQDEHPHHLNLSDFEQKIPNGGEHRYVTPLLGQKHDSSEHLYSDFSSSKETVRQHSAAELHGHQVHVNKNLGTRGAKHPFARSEYTEDESSDSAGSSEFSRHLEKNHVVPPRGSYPVQGHHYNATSRVDLESTGKDTNGDGLKNIKSPDVDIPSAPPFCASSKEINQCLDQTPGSKPSTTPCTANSNRSSNTKEPIPSKNMGTGVCTDNNRGGMLPDQCIRTSTIGEEAIASSSGALPVRLPTFHASGQGPWQAVIAYDACVRLCLNSWARGCMEAPVFLENECAVLRNAFGLQQILLQSEEELLAKQSTQVLAEGAVPKPKKTIGRMKVQVRKVKMILDMPPGCSFSTFKTSVVNLDSLHSRLSNLRSTLSSGWGALKRVRVLAHAPANSSFSQHTLAYLHASAEYIKQVSGVLKIGVTTLRNSSSSEIFQESYSCLLRLKSSSEEEAFRMQPGSGEVHVFFPDSLGDDLIVEVHDSKGNIHGRVLAQVATIAEDPSDKLRWWSIYREPDHEVVGKLQLYITYTTSLDENGAMKCGPVAETVAYDLVLEVAMKVQHFQQRNLLLHGSWKWLLTEFASYFGVSDAYTRLRYLSYVMDVATPTADCLVLVHDLLLPVVKRNNESTLSRQEKRILGEIEEQVEQILALVFENYKSLDESLPSGMVDIIRPASGVPAAALAPAVKLFTLLHDILSPEVQLKLCGYFQAAAKKRSRRHLVETDEFVGGNNECISIDAVTLSTAYSKMKVLCLNIRNEVYTDIEIHEQHVLPSFVDLPNLCASIYSVELCSRLRAFLVACPPSGPTSFVAELVVATADFQRDLSNWNISPVKGGVDAKELFHLYIVHWIEDKRRALLETCKLDKVKWSGVTTQHSTTPFVDEMYDRLMETMNEYDIIICRWPGYAFVLENAITDIEKAVLEALEKQYADVLAPLKDGLTPKKFGLKYVQKITRLNSQCPYIVHEELGILLNTIKRLLDVLRPKIESQLKSWVACIPVGGSMSAGERLSEITVMLRSKFRNYLQAVVEKLVENTRMQSTTKLKKIIQDTKELVAESDIRLRMQPLKDQITNTIDHLHTVFETQVFLSICRGYWDRMGQDVLSFLENRKENRSWYKGSRVTVNILDDTFASQMQQLLGNALQEKDLEPPRSIMEVRSMLCKDGPSKDSNFYY